MIVRHFVRWWWLAKSKRQVIRTILQVGFIIIFSEARESKHPVLFVRLSPPSKGHLLLYWIFLLIKNHWHKEEKADREPEYCGPRERFLSTWPIGGRRITCLSGTFAWALWRHATLLVILVQTQQFIVTLADKGNSADSKAESATFVSIFFVSRN